MPTALEIAQGRSVPLTEGLFEAIQTETPLLSAMDARSIEGTEFHSLAIISLPSSGFVNYGEGFVSSSGSLALRQFSCSLIGGLIMAECITSRRWDKEHQLSGYTFFDLQTRLKFLADMMHIEEQLIKGTSADGKGFPGAKELTPFAAGTLAMTDEPGDFDFERPVLNVGGTTAATASSVYSFVFGDLDSQLILGDDSGGELVRMGEIRREFHAPDSAQPEKINEHDLAQLEGFIGFSVSGFNQQIAGQTVPTQYSLRRACNITKDSGKTCTDEVMDILSRMHGTGKTPDLFAMSHRSGKQLASSRTATAVNFFMGMSGDARNSVANIQPPPPDNWEGVPIVYPRPAVIGNTDAIEA